MQTTEGESKFPDTGRVNVCKRDTNGDEENDTDGFVYEGEKK